MKDNDSLPSDSMSLANYIRDRISANNYREAYRATLHLAARLAPDDMPRAWTSTAELRRLDAGFSASLWHTKYRYSDVDVEVFALPPPPLT
jgi:hypothetical protein